MSNMFNVGKLSTFLDSIDSAAKETIHADDDDELPSVIRSKRRGEDQKAEPTHKETNKEVERLHAECLELEKQVESLTDEVKRAWGAYQGIQEKLSVQELQLTEEIAALETSKAEEHASLTASVVRLTEELEISQNRFDLLLTENKKIMQDLEGRKAQTEAFEAREKVLMVELEEAKACSSSNAAVIREQLIAAEAAMETMRADHSSWMLQSHKRQEQLEQSNAELASSLTEAQRTIIKLRNGDDRLERDHATMREVEDLRKAVDELMASQEEMSDKYNEQARQIQSREREMKAAHLLWDDERARFSEVADKYASDIEVLQCEISKLRQDTNCDITVGAAMLKKTELEEQVKMLSQQLLKKQANVQELLAERSALKVRVQDLISRCTKAEELANNLMYSDFESGTGGESNDYDYSYAQSSSIGGSSRTLLKRKGVARNNLVQSVKSDISSDLEKAYGVKTAPALARAFNTIDTWAQLTGRFLLLYPIMRLAFCLYLLFLHLWVFVVLIFHVHSLEHDAFAPPNQPQ